VHKVTPALSLLSAERAEEVDPASHLVIFVLGEGDLGVTVLEAEGQTAKQPVLTLHCQPGHLAHAQGIPNGAALVGINEHHCTGMAVEMAAALLLQSRAHLPTELRVRVSHQQFQSLRQGAAGLFSDHGAVQAKAVDGEHSTKALDPDLAFGAPEATEDTTESSMEPREESLSDGESSSSREASSSQPLDGDDTAEEEPIIFLALARVRTPIHLPHDQDKSSRIGGAVTGSVFKIHMRATGSHVAERRGRTMASRRLRQAACDLYWPGSLEEEMAKLGALRHANVLTPKLTVSSSCGSMEVSVPFAHSSLAVLLSCINESDLPFMAADAPTALSIGTQVAKAIAFIHSHGIRHGCLVRRCLKPLARTCISPIAESASLLLFSFYVCLPARLPPA
jgi:hypothetical protein